MVKEVFWGFFKGEAFHLLQNINFIYNRWTIKLFKWFLLLMVPPHKCKWWRKLRSRVNDLSITSSFIILVLSPFWLMSSSNENSATVSIYTYVYLYQFVKYLEVSGFQSNHPKTRSICFHFLLPQPRVEPRTFQSWVHYLAIWAISPLPISIWIPHNVRKVENYLAFTIVITQFLFVNRGCPLTEPATALTKIIKWLYQSKGRGIH